MITQPHRPTQCMRSERRLQQQLPQLDALRGEEGGLREQRRLAAVPAQHVSVELVECGVGQAACVPVSPRVERGIVSEG